MSDFPAAHSMDTEWFAVDDAGHVAVFDSYEGGAVPDDAPPSGLDVDLADVVAAVPWVDERHPEQRTSWSRAADAAQGIFVYQHTLTDNHTPGPYTRVARPLVPLRADAMPAALGAVTTRLQGVRFAHRPLLQPMDYATCRAYTDQRWISLEFGALVATDDLARASQIAEWLRTRGWSALTVDPVIAVRRWLEGVADGDEHAPHVARLAAENPLVAAVLGVDAAARLARLAADGDGHRDFARRILATTLRRTP